MGKIRFKAPGNASGSAAGGNDDVTALRRTMERYRRLLRMVTDPRAIAGLKQLLAETEERLVRRAHRSNGAPAAADQ